MADLPRPLTDGEVALLKRVFGNGLNYSDIRIDEGGEPGTATRRPLARTQFDTMNFPEPLTDFSQGELWQQAWLIHEAVHVWQWQQFEIDTYQEGHQLFFSKLGDYHSAYEWSLSDNFSKMNIEQQAQAVEDRFLVDHHIPPSYETDLRQGQPNPPLASYDELLKPFYAQNIKGPPPHRKLPYGWNRHNEDGGGGFSEEPSPDATPALLEEEQEQLRQRVAEIWAVLDTIDPDDPSFDQTLIDDFVDALNAQLDVVNNLTGSDLRDRIQDLLARLDQWQDYFDNLIANSRGIDDTPTSPDEVSDEQGDWSSYQEEDEEPVVAQLQSSDEDEAEPEAPPPEPDPDDDPW